MSFVILIPLSIGMGLVALGAFFWALRNNQFDDPDGAAWRVIPPDTPPSPEGKRDDKLAPDAANRHG